MTAQSEQEIRNLRDLGDAQDALARAAERFERNIGGDAVVRCLAGQLHVWENERIPYSHVAPTLDQAEKLRDYLNEVLEPEKENADA